ncbi:MAG: hypothetical protein JWO94_3929 [Verrucomicrobiaceae bacterium]|nr:hypothetical protein [Verrucomicrobiaceae bacterium]
MPPAGVTDVAAGAGVSGWKKAGEASGIVGRNGAAAGAGAAAKGPEPEGATGGSRWKISLAGTRTLNSRFPCAITVRKVFSVPSMMVPRSMMTWPEGSCWRTRAAGSLVLIQAGMKLGSKPKSCGVCPFNTAASEISTFSSALVVPAPANRAGADIAGRLKVAAAGAAAGIWTGGLPKGMAPSLTGSGEVGRGVGSNEATPEAANGEGGCTGS